MAKRDLTNRVKVRKIDSTLTDLLEKVLVRGFHGTASVEFTIQDGVIQNIRRKVGQEVT
ncbi:hypothetical protein LCGC14_2379830 [marine sediment metagenome]|uniref:DUF2292 domain-containing protein n=1 Tax=marine sediment metagenome TaxID=412755 RepID=A0A0F9EW07_9ZZZZ